MRQFTFRKFVKRAATVAVGLILLDLVVTTATLAFGVGMLKR